MLLQVFTYKLSVKNNDEQTHTNHEPPVAGELSPDFFTGGREATHNTL